MELRYLSMFIIGIIRVSVDGIGDNKSESDESQNMVTFQSSRRNRMFELRIQPNGSVPLGKNGVTLDCLTGNNDVNMGENIREIMKNVSWFVNEKPAPPCGAIKCELMNNSSLHLFQTEDSNFGSKVSERHEYRCIGKFKIGSSRSSPTVIEIPGAIRKSTHPEFTRSVLPSIISYPAHSINEEGQEINFTCRANGTPRPQIYWLKDSQRISSNRRREIHTKDDETTELIISNVLPEDAGIYQCVAANSAGEVSSVSTFALKKSRITAPTFLSCSCPLTGSIIISWQPANSKSTFDHFNYFIVYSPENELSKILSLVVLPDATFAVIHNIKTDTNYFVHVVALDENGGKYPSEKISCSPISRVQKVEPETVAQRISTFEYNVEWEPLEVNESIGVTDRYEIQWADLEDVYLGSVFVPANENQHVFRGLKFERSYCFRVLARTKNGSSIIKESQSGWVVVEAVKKHNPFLERMSHREESFHFETSERPEKVVSYEMDSLVPKKNYILGIILGSSISIVMIIFTLHFVYKRREQSDISIALLGNASIQENQVLTTLYHTFCEGDPMWSVEEQANDCNSSADIELIMLPSTPLTPTSPLIDTRVLIDVSGILSSVQNDCSDITRF